MTILKDGVAVTVTPSTTYHEPASDTLKTASVTISMEYTNYTDQDLYLKTQNNLPIAITPNKISYCPDAMGPHLEVKLVYTISGSAINKTFELISALQENGMVFRQDVEALRTRLINEFKDSPFKRNRGNFVFCLSRRIYETDLDANRSVYMRECDIVISKHKSDIVLPHPNSNEGLQQFDKTRLKKYADHAGVFIRVIDNNLFARQRYYHSGKQLITVPSIVDKSMEDGVYITISTMGPDGTISTRSEYLSYEEAEEKIGLYKTQEEAMSHGDPEIALRTEEARNKAEERRLRNELVQFQHQAAMEETSRKEEIARLNHMNELMKAENISLKESIDVRKTVREDSYDIVKRDRDWDYDSRKRRREDYYEDRKYHRGDFYEERSYERKDSSEMLKYVSAFAIGLVTTYAMMNKAGSK